MKVGSLVECISDDFCLKRVTNIIPKINNIYTVRGIFPCTCGKCGTNYVHLEEIINPLLPILAGIEIIMIEPAFEMENFREIEFNEDQIKELINEELPCII